MKKSVTYLSKSFSNLKAVVLAILKTDAIYVGRNFLPLDRGAPFSLGRFRLIALLGSGGFAKVYLGKDQKGNLAAFKVPHNFDIYDVAVKESFSFEVKLAARVISEHVTTVVAYDVDGTTAVSMMFLFLKRFN